MQTLRNSDPEWRNIHGAGRVGVRVHITDRAMVGDADRLQFVCSRLKVRLRGLPLETAHEVGWIACMVEPQRMTDLMPDRPRCHNVTRYTAAACRRIWNVIFKFKPSTVDRNLRSAAAIRCTGIRKLDCDPARNAFP